MLKNVLKIMVLFLLNPIIVIGIGITSLLLRLLNKSGTLMRSIVKNYLQFHIHLTGLVVEVTGIEHISPKERYLVLSNFNEVSDIITIIHSFPHPQIVPIIRIHNFFIPFIGWIMNSSRFISFNSKKPANFITSAINRLNDGLSVLHFPAGYSDLSKSKFLYNNFLRIAKRSKARLLPVRVTHFPKKVLIEYMPDIPLTLDNETIKSMLAEFLQVS